MNIRDLDRLEKDSIRSFLAECGDAGLLYRNVLDYGCGRRPYEALVLNRGGSYVPYDQADYPGGSGGNVGSVDPFAHKWDTILLTQVIQYVERPYRLLRKLRDALVPGGVLLMTYPGAWPQLPGDLCHWTRLGMGGLLTAAAFEVELNDVRLALPYDGFEIPVGYQAIGRA